MKPRQLDLLATAPAPKTKAERRAAKTESQTLPDTHGGWRLPTKAEAAAGHPRHLFRTTDVGTFYVFPSLSVVGWHGKIYNEPSGDWNLRWECGRTVAERLSGAIPVVAWAGAGLEAAKARCAEIEAWLRAGLDREKVWLLCLPRSWFDTGPQDEYAERQRASRVAAEAFLAEHGLPFTPEPEEPAPEEVPLLPGDLPPPWLRFLSFPMGETNHPDRDVRCPICAAAPGEPCRGRFGPGHSKGAGHQARERAAFRLWEAQPDETRTAANEPASPTPLPGEQLLLAS